MAEVFRYEVIPPSSWAYLSTILMVSLYLKFGRLFSIRNLDIVLLALLAPGLLIVQHCSDKRVKLNYGFQALSREIERAENPDPDPKGQAQSVKLEKKESDESAAQPNSDPSAKNRQIESEHSTAEGIDLLKAKLLSMGESSKYYLRLQFRGFLWLFFVSGCLMVRMLVDPYMIRRPLLEPNLEFSGLTFMTVVLLLFLVVNLITANIDQDDIQAAASGKDLATATANNSPAAQGPGYQLIAFLPVIPTFAVDEDESDVIVNQFPRRVETSLIYVAKLMAIIGQLAVVVGIYLVGFLHFNNTRIGIGVVTLYLLLPYTAEMTGRVIHILPAAALVWAIVCYRRPFWAGLFIGFAMGLAYYPLFLLPLWFSFYWHKGLKSFVFGFAVIIVILATTLVFTSADIPQFFQNLRAMFGAWIPLMEGLNGIWEKGNLDSSYRVPIIAAFFCMSISFAVWPAQKDLGALLSCSASLMLAVQFWHGFGGGLLMAWYLPLALMTMFRPNLEDKTAISLKLDK